MSSDDDLGPPPDEELDDEAVEIRDNPPDWVAETEHDPWSYERSVSSRPEVDDEPPQVDDAYITPRDLDFPSGWPRWLDPPEPFDGALEAAGHQFVEMRWDPLALWEGLKKAGLDATTAAQRVHDLSFALTELKAAERFVNEQLNEHRYADIRVPDTDSATDAERAAAVDKLASLLGDPNGAGIWALRSRRVFHMLLFGLTTSDQVDRIAAAFAKGLRARDDYRAAQSRGGAPRKVSDKASIRQEYQQALRDLEGFRAAATRRNNREQAISVLSASLRTQLTELGLLDKWLPPSSRDACKTVLSDMAAEFVAAKHRPSLKRSTVLNYARRRAKKQST